MNYRKEICFSRRN